MTIEVLDGGALTSVQDAAGRSGWRHLGVPVGGAGDRWSARLANALVGNAPDAAVLEVTMRGPVLRFGHATVVALGGSRFDATVDGAPIDVGEPRRVRAGSVLAIGTGDGARCYLAVSGGIDVPSVLGSRATDLRSGFGGHEGRALQRGDRLHLGHPTGSPLRWMRRSPTGGPLRVAKGPHAGIAALVGPTWSVGPEADRVGVRLDGPRLRLEPAEIPSIGLPEGAIQVPPDGRPIITLADRPVTGGYPVPACVIGADAGRAAQLRPGDLVAFVLVSADDARAAWEERVRAGRALEAVRSSADEDLRWTGSLE